MNVLMAWVGKTDLNSSANNESGKEIGPIAQAIEHLDFDKIVLFYNYAKEEVDPFIKWLEARETRLPIFPFEAELSSPTNYAEIYPFVKTKVDSFLAENSDVSLTFHLSPGTPAMAAVWLLLAKTIFPARLIEASREAGVEVAEVPFDIHLDFLPQTLRAYGELLEKTMQLPNNISEFSNIVYESKVMERVISQARKVAMLSVSVLIEGESGTGKEVLAKAIHNGGPRKEKPFIAINCGAISPEIIESELFGHVKGAFTGAANSNPGYFQSANGGTLFLDEIGDLPMGAQVKLLRALQEKEITPVGSTESKKIDVRIIAATHKNLIEEVSQNRFREDLFYRLAVAILTLPPLRERGVDLGLLIDHCLSQIESADAEHKKLSVGARKRLLNHPWPGNIRELLNTLQRASLWSVEEKITEQDIQDAFISVPIQSEKILNRPLHNGIDLPEILDEVEKHYLERALKQAGGVKKNAAHLLGLNNATTFNNKIKKHDL